MVLPLGHMASLLLWEEQRAAKPCADSGSASARNGAGHPSCLPSMARPGKLKSRVCGPCDRPGHCVQKGPVLVLILRCHLLDILNSYWPRGAHIFIPQTLQPVLVESEQPDLKEAREMYMGAPRPPRGQWASRSEVLPVKPLREAPCLHHSGSSGHCSQNS